MNRRAEIPENAEIDNEGDSSRRAILAAMQRIFLGQPKWVPVGATSISDLAREAQVGRHVLYRSLDLKDRFAYLRDTAHQPTAPELQLHEQMAKLKSEVTDLRQLQSRTYERAESWKALGTTLERAINVLQEELRQEQIKSERLARRLSDLKTESGVGSAPVIPLRPRPNSQHP
jgi:AcrR family transcriptional regulator